MRSSPVKIPRSAVRAGAVRSGWIPWEKTIPGVCRSLFSRVKSGLRGERTSNKVSEPFRLRRRRSATLTEPAGETPNKQRLGACGYPKALLAGNAPLFILPQRFFCKIKSILL